VTAAWLYRAAEQASLRHRGRRGRIAAFLLGVLECRDDSGMTYDNDPWSPRSVAYDRGRTLGERLAR
jgi:hypothetical protein